jgi:hypothetical protein
MHSMKKLCWLLFVGSVCAIPHVGFASEPLNLPKLTLPQTQSTQKSNQKTFIQPNRELRALTLTAKLSKKGNTIEDGIVWRVFKSDINRDGKLPLITTATGGTMRFSLPEGNYLVHAGFGRAGITKRIKVSAKSREEILVLDAGAVTLNATVSGGIRIPSDKLRFSIYVGEELENGERPLIIPDVKPDDIIRLNAGTYHVVSHYGNVNAVIRTDIVVEAGALIAANVEHKAAEITLKLVREKGGEAMADTAWSVINPSGEVIKESVGAFAPMILSEGDYVVIAKNKERLYQRDFTVVSGRNQDIEVLLAQSVSDTLDIIKRP